MEPIKKYNNAAINKAVISSSVLGGTTLGFIGTTYSLISGSYALLPPLSTMVGLTVGAVSGYYIYMSMLKLKNEKETPREQSGGAETYQRGREGREKSFSAISTPGVS